jgi:hypothetical protein
MVYKVRRYYKRKRETERRKKIAKERIEILEKEQEKRPKYAKRYKELIEKIKKKYRLKGKV